MVSKIHPRSSIHELFQIGTDQEESFLDQEVYSRVNSSYNHLLKHLDHPSARIYGIHTHYGYNVADVIQATSWQEHQAALLSYLKVGTGETLDSTIVRRALWLQAYKIGLGYSGVHPDTFQDLIRLCQCNQIPQVPRFGSLGASGDLIPMAHAVAPLFHEKPPKGPRDVIALVNTNAMMSSVAIDCWTKGWAIYRQAHMIWLLNAHALGWAEFGLQSAGWDARSSLRPFRSRWTAEMALTQNSLSKTPGLSELREVKLPAQEKYSIRCAPQILQDIGENLLFAAEKILEESLGLADNPIVLEESIWHGGHFYASGLATASDLMNDAVSRLVDMIDRQILILVTSECNHGLPPNLMTSLGDHVKGLHQLASSLLQRMRGLQTPARSMSFSCESNNQDVVPASMNALLQLQDLLCLGDQVCRIGSFIGERGLCLRYDLPLPPELALSQWAQFDCWASWQQRSWKVPLAEACG